jgi:hypothetical protein
MEYKSSILFSANTGIFLLVTTLKPELATTEALIQSETYSSGTQ